VNYLKSFGAVLAYATLVTSSREQLRQDPTTHGVIVHDQNLYAGISGHLFFGFGSTPPAHCIHANLAKVSPKIEKKLFNDWQQV
jgi:hypothetical protein